MTTDEHVIPKTRQWTVPPTIEEVTKPPSKRGGKKGKRKHSSKDIDRMIEGLLEIKETFTPQELQVVMGIKGTPNNVLRLRASRGLISKLDTGLYTRGPGVPTGKPYRKVKAKATRTPTSRHPPITMFPPTRTTRASATAGRPINKGNRLAEYLAA